MASGRCEIPGFTSWPGPLRKRELEGQRLQSWAPSRENSALSRWMPAPRRSPGSHSGCSGRKPKPDLPSGEDALVFGDLAGRHRNPDRFSRTFHRICVQRRVHLQPAALVLHTGVAGQSDQSLRCCAQHRVRRDRRDRRQRAFLGRFGKPIPLPGSTTFQALAVTTELATPGVIPVPGIAAWNILLCRRQGGR